MYKNVMKFFGIFFLSSMFIFCFFNICIASASSVVLYETTDEADKKINTNDLEDSSDLQIMRDNELKNESPLPKTNSEISNNLFVVGVLLVLTYLVSKWKKRR